ncbi:dihydrofolate reductase family protein [Solimonas soli]|uniref:dihydrofolate reductase family protein n=1 Tax=Solimonas soli TaxID=413479 RepID=UPI00048399CF|nr:dihydrofolate reductase family protein [Solimonas soli]
MSRVRVAALSMSIDGFCAGPRQSLEAPLGGGGLALHEWALATATFRRMFGESGGATDVDDHYAARSFDNVGAWILGRNMFGPVRGPWSEPAWNGWWGEEPPYHVPVFVLTHHARAPLAMRGGTTFHFVTDGIDAALARARQAAGGRDVRIGGGVASVRQYLQRRLIDEMHLAVTPVVLGAGESLFGGLDLLALGYRCVEHQATGRATHVVLQRA